MHKNLEHYCFSEFVWQLHDVMHKQHIINSMILIYFIPCKHFKNNSQFYTPTFQTRTLILYLYKLHTNSSKLFIQNRRHATGREVLTVIASMTTQEKPRSHIGTVHITIHNFILLFAKIKLISTTLWFISWPFIGNNSNILCNTIKTQMTVFVTIAEMFDTVKFWESSSV